MLVKDLKARAPIEEIELEIVSKAEPRAFATEKGEGIVCNCAAKDKKGVEVSLTLWNEQIAQVSEGDKVKILQGWCSEFRGALQVSTGRKGTLEVLK
ncbi:MAG: hypothetical protein QXK06_03490 [Candidatus Diapherotrites archaeon]